MIRLYFLILFQLIFIICLGQDQWKSFNAENGLAADYARKHLVRESGDVWLLTGQIVNIFDGNSWTQLDQVKDGITGIQHLFKDIIYMNEGPDGHVWLGTKTGLFEYDGEKWQFHKERWNKKFGWQGFTIRYFSMDAQGYVWAFLEKDEMFPTDITRKWTIGLMYRFTGTEWEIHKGVAGRTAWNSGERSKHFKRFFTDKYNNFWVLTYDGFCIWNGANWQLYDGIKVKETDAYITDTAGNTWMGNRYGLRRYDGYSWTTFKKKDGLAATWVYYLYVDDRNRVWAFTKSQNYNTFKGLSCFTDGQWTNYPYSKDGYVFPAYSLNHPGDENMWMGGEGKISVFNGSGWKTYTNKDGLQKGKYKLILKDRNNDIFAVGDNKFIMKLEGESWEPIFGEEDTGESQGFNIRHTDNEGNIWLGVKSKGLYKYDGENWSHFNEGNGLIAKHVKRIFEDKQGNVWFVTEKGVSIYFH